MQQVLFYWRGTWILLDSYLFPDQPHWSAWASLLIGMIGMILHNAYLIWLGNPVNSQTDTQNTVQEVELNSKTSNISLKLPAGEEDMDFRSQTTGTVQNDNGLRRAKLSFMKSYLINNLKTYYFGFIVVNAWRGLWYCQDLYIIFPDTPMLSPWVSHIGGIIMLMALAHFQSVLAPPYCHMPDEMSYCFTASASPADPVSTK